MTQRVVEGGVVVLCLAGWGLLIAISVRAVRTMHLPRRFRGA